LPTWLNKGIHFETKKQRLNMLFKEIQSIEEARQYFSAIENEESGFAFRGLSVNIIEFPKTPINSIFNRIVYNNSTKYYFSVSLEPIKKISSTAFKNRAKRKDSLQDKYGETKQQNYLVNDTLNYDSAFFAIQNQVEFLVEWLNSVFSIETISSFLNGRNWKTLLIEYKKNFQFPGNDAWKATTHVLRITEIRNDLRVLVFINPYDLHPEISFTSLEETGIVTPVMIMIYQWFNYKNLLSIDRRFTFSFHEEARYNSFPMVSNNEQRFKINVSPFNIDGKSLVDIVMKGSRRQLSLYKTYFKQVLDFYPEDLFGKGEFEGEEAVAVDFFDKKLRYMNGRRVYIKPEFDFFIGYHATMEKDENGMEYPEFHFQMQYRPFIKSREEAFNWTWHHVEEDLGK
jgi:hypothetical protein